MKRRKFYSLLFLMLGFCAYSQNNSPAAVESNLILVSEDKAGHPIKYSVVKTYMLLSLSNGDFTLNADLSSISTGNKRQDSIVASYGTQLLSFKGNIGENLMVFNR